MSDNTQHFQAPGSGPVPPSSWPPPSGAPFSEEQVGPVKRKMSRGKKVGLWSGGLLVALLVVGAIGGDPKTAPTAATAAISPSSRVAAAPTSTDSDTAAADKAAAEKAAADKAAAEKAAADKAAAEKAAAEKAAAAKAAAAKKAAAEKAAAEKAAAEKAAAEKAAAEKAAAEKAAAEKAAAEKAAAEQAANAMTVSQEQAVSQAESYLEMTAFSRTGLIEQLQFEQFSKADATFAVDHITVNWKEQAAKKARSYLEMTSFSRGGLIDQLKFEGFTTAQATYGVNAVGL